MTAFITLTKDLHNDSDRTKWPAVHVNPDMVAVVSERRNAKTLATIPGSSIAMQGTTNTIDVVEEPHTVLALIYEMRARARLVSGYRLGVVGSY